MGTQGGEEEKGWGGGCQLAALYKAKTAWGEGAGCRCQCKVSGVCADSKPLLCHAAFSFPSHQHAAVAPGCCHAPLSRTFESLKPRSTLPPQHPRSPAPPPTHPPPLPPVVPSCSVCSVGQLLPDVDQLGEAHGAAGGSTTAAGSNSTGSGHTQAHMGLTIQA